MTKITDTRQCPLCDWNKSYKSWGRHMVASHGWRYRGNLVRSPKADESVSDLVVKSLEATDE